MVEISERLLVEVQANTLRAQRSMEKFGKTVQTQQKKTNKNLSLIDRGFDKIAKKVKQISFKRLALGTTALATGFAFATKRAIEFADRIGKTADKIGVSTDALQELRFAASQTGVEQGKLDMALQRFVRRTGEAAQGAGELRGILEQYQIQVTDSNGRTRAAIDVLKDLADATKTAGSAQEQLRIAFKAFDSEGAALVNLLRRGSDGIEELQRQARRLGLVMDESLIRQAEQANDQLSILFQSFRTTFASSLVGIAPAIVEIGSAIRNVIPAITEFWERWALPENMQSVAMLNQRMADLLATIRKFESGEISESVLPDFAPGIQSLKEAREEFERLSAARDQAIIKRDALNALTPSGNIVPPPVDTKAQEKIEDTLEALRNQAEALGTTAQQQAVLNNLRAAGIEVTAAQVTKEGELTAGFNAEAQEIAKITNRIFERTEAEDKARAALDARVQKEQAIRDIVESVRTEEERHIETLKRLKEAEEEGIITTEERIETQKRLQEALDKTKEKEEEQEEAIERQKDVARDVISETERALTGSLKTWEDYGAAVLRILQNIILAQLEAARTAPGSSPGLFNGGILGFLGLGSSPTPISGGITTSPPGLRVQSGGTIPGGFGGGDRVPAMLEPGEEVIKKDNARRFRPLLKKINAFQSGGTVGAAAMSAGGFGSSVSLTIGTIDARGATPGTAEQIRGVVRGELQRAAAGLNSFGRTTTQQRRGMVAGIRRGASMDSV